MGFLQKRGKQPPEQIGVAANGSGIVIERDGILNYRFESAIKKTKFEEFVRMKLNYRVVTFLSWFNLLILFPLALFSWLMNLFGFFDFAFLNYLSWGLFIPLWFFPYVTWHYSTITIPKKKGKVILGDWSKTKKGRWKAAIFNLLPFHVLSWCAGAKYVFDYFLDYLTGVRLYEPYTDFLLTDDLNSLLLVLFFAPVLFSAIGVFLQVRDYMINQDLLKEHFKTWEAPYFKRFAHEYELGSCDIIVGYEIGTKKPIIIKENERFLHESIFGATGTGKTSTTLLLRIASDLIKIATGEREQGLIFIEPKGDAVDDVLTLCKKLGIPKEKIKVIDPTKSWSVKYNPFSGHRESAATSFQGTLNALTADQDDFFRGQQNEAASFYTLLAKIRYGNLTNITHIQRMFTDPRYLADVVEYVRRTINDKKDAIGLTDLQKNELDAYDRIVSYFEDEVLDYKWFRDKDVQKPIPYPQDHRYAGRQMVENKKDKFVTGAKKYLNEIANNSLLKTLFVCNDGEEIFNADEFLKEGGIVLVNTALGDLDELSLLFGQFFIRQFQSAVFRRAKECKETGVERIPIFCYIDEFPLYANEAFERFLTLGRSYKVGAIIAMQSIAQLDSVGLAYRKSVLGNTSHKTVFGRAPVEDNEYFSKEFGEHLVVEESMNESGSPMTTDRQVWGYRLNTQKKLVPRFTSTDIRELPFKEMIVQVVNEQNSIGIPKHAVGQFVSESKFVSRFMKLVETEIKSNDEKPFVYTDHVSPERLSTLTDNVSKLAEKVPAATAEEILDVTDSHSLIGSEFAEELYILRQEVGQVFNQQESAATVPPQENMDTQSTKVIQFPISQEVAKEEDLVDEFEETVSISVFDSNESATEEFNLPFDDSVQPSKNEPNNDLWIQELGLEEHEEIPSWDELDGQGYPAPEDEEVPIIEDVKLPIVEEPKETESLTSVSNEISEFNSTLFTQTVKPQAFIVGEKPSSVNQMSLLIEDNQLKFESESEGESKPKESIEDIVPEEQSEKEPWKATIPGNHPQPIKVIEEDI